MADVVPHRPVSLTARYTAGVWAASGFPEAWRFVDREVRDVYRVTDAVIRFAQRLVPAVPSLRAALVHRRALIDRWILDDQPPLVLDLAAGLSPRGAWLSGLGIPVVEVDFPSVIAHKERMLAASDGGAAVLSRPAYRRVGADLLGVSLGDVAAPAPGAFVIAEGLLVYLEPGQQRALFAEVARWLAAGGTFCFDLVPAAEHPDAGWVGRALGTLMKWFTRGAEMKRDARDRASILAELRAAGFDRAEAVAPMTVAAALDLPLAHEPSAQLVFRATVAPR